MKKKFPHLLIILLGLNTACSTNFDAQKSGAAYQHQPADDLQKSHAKVTRSKHHNLPEGIISLDIVGHNNRLHLLTGKHQHGQKTLWYQFSTNGGESWSATQKVLNADNLAIKMLRGNDAQIAVQGKNILATWTKYDPEARFNAGAMMAARSDDAGQTWHYSATPPDWKKGPHGYIDMAADNQAMHAVWLDSRNGHTKTKASQALHYARSIDGGLSWQKNITLDSLTCSCCWNTIKSDSTGNTYVLYRDKQPSDLSIGVIKRQQWQRLSHVGAFNWQFDGCPHIGGGLDFQRINDHSRLHAVVGTGHQEHLGVHYLYSNDNGASWSSPKQLGDESATHADIAAHDNGRVIAVWDMMGEESLAVFMAESQDQGTSWTKAQQISNAGMRATHPRIVKTETGFLALWTENNGLQQKLATKRL